MAQSWIAAAWFLPFVVPIAFLVAQSDMARLKIPNTHVIALVAVFAVVGLIALPFGDYLWRWSHLGVVLVIGFLLNLAGAMGAGDAKFAAAAAPFVALGDLTLVFAILAAASLAGFATHRLAMRSFGPRVAPEWESWTSGRRFPMGLPLAMALVFYLAAGIFLGA